MNISCLAERDFRQYLRGERGWSVELLERLPVPLKINFLNMDPDWLAFLKTCGLTEVNEIGSRFGLTVQPGGRNDYQYWHELQIYKLVRKSA